jgi:hypothetical protein
MATLDDFLKTDLVDDHVAEDVNKLIGAVLRAEYRNVETIMATKELADGDCQFQNITASGANRTVELAPEATTNHFFVISNVGGSNNVVVKDDSGATTYITLLPGEWAMFVSNGSTWKMLEGRDTLQSYFDTLYQAGSADNSICDFRLTLTTATPVTTSDVTAATSVYITPFKGNRIALYDGSSSWNIRTSAEITVALGTLTSGLPYDIFVYDNAGTVTARTPVAWTNGTTRATALTLQDGVLVKTGATTDRYLGTFYTTSTTTTEDSTSKRYLFNYYNRVLRTLKATDATNSWAYTTASYREANGGSTLGTSRVGLMVGWSENIVTASSLVAGTNSSGSAVIAAGIGLDSATNVAQINTSTFTSSTVALNSVAFWRGYPGVGMHTIHWLELGGSNVTLYGDNGGTIFQTGLVAEAWM